MPDRMERTEAAAHQRRLHEDEIAMQRRPRRPATMPENVITRWECQRCGTGWVDVGTTVMCQADFTVCGARAECHYVAGDTLHEWIEERRKLAVPRSDELNPGRAYELDRLSALLDDLTTGGKTDG